MRRATPALTLSETAMRAMRVRANGVVQPEDACLDKCDLRTNAAICRDVGCMELAALLEGATVASSWVPQLWCTIESHLAHCGTATHCNHSQARVRQVRIAASYGSEF